VQKSILISIKTEHAVNILNGSKTLELRKSVPKDFVGWVYMCVTKKLPLLAYEVVDYDDSWGYPTTDGGYSIQNHIDDFDQIQGDVLNGKVVARWWFDEYDTYYLERPLNLEITYRGDGSKNGCEYTKETKTLLLKKSCLTFQEIWDYGKKRFDNQQSMVYAWHIKKLEILEPMELEEFDRLTTNREHAMNWNNDWTSPTYSPLTKAPQSWRYVWVKEKV